MRTIDEFIGEYSFLSNFYTSHFMWKGLLFRSNEHFYQAHKAVNTQDFETVRNCETASRAKKVGRFIAHNPIIWERDKEGVMLLGLFLKFTQNTDLLTKLMATGDAMLIEGNTWGDKVWGAVRNSEGKWEGQNLLGLQLMILRSNFNNIANTVQKGALNHASNI